jgi:uncharacterized UBP type Zn finger protein
LRQPHPNPLFISFPQVFRSAWLQQLNANYDFEPVLKGLRELCIGIGTGLDIGARQHICELFFIAIGNVKSDFENVDTQCDPHELLAWMYENYTFLFSEYLITTAQTIQCPQCHNTHIQRHNSACISLDLRTNIKDSLQDFQTETEIHKWPCDNCTYTGKTGVRILLETTSKFLCLHMKRWDAASLRKNSTKLCIPDVLTVGAQTYKLYAIIQHHGRTVNSGHYIAFVQYDGFVCMNDISVKRINPNCERNMNAYIVVYSL